MLPVLAKFAVSTIQHNTIKLYLTPNEEKFMSVTIQTYRYRFIVWYLARSAICPTSHKYSLVTGPVPSSVISTPRGAYSLAATFGAQNYSNTLAFTVLPGTHLFLGRQSARVGKVPCLGAQRRSIIQPNRGSNARSLACKSRTLPLSHDAPQT